MENEKRDREPLANEFALNEADLQYVSGGAATGDSEPITLDFQLIAEGGSRPRHSQR